MEVYVIDKYRSSSTPHFPIIGIVPSYHSILWNKQLYGLGYFEMTVAATKENMNLLQKGRFLVRQKDIEVVAGRSYYRNAMIIRRVETISDQEMGKLLIVSGKSVKDIVSQRIVWDRYEAVNQPLTTVIFTVFNRNITDPEQYVQGVVDDLNDEIDALYDARDEKSVEVTQAQADYEQAVADYGADSPEAAAAKEIWDTKEEEYEAILEALVLKNRELTYWDMDLTIQSKREIPYIIAGLIDNVNPPRVTVQLRGENIGEWMENICTENHFGWDLAMSDSSMVLTFNQGTDKSDTIIFSSELDNLKNSTYVTSLENFKNAGLVTGEEFDEGYGPFPIAADVGTSTGDSRYEVWIEANDIEKNEDTSAADYYNMLVQYGKSAIIPYKKVSSLTGEIDPDGMFKIGVDYDLGDLVKVQNEQGISAKLRLVEILDSDEASGKLTNGTFEEWED